MISGALIPSTPGVAQPPDRTLQNTIPGLILEMRAKKIGPQMALDNGLIDADGIVYALGDANLMSDEEAMEFARVLVKNCDDCLKAPTKLTADGRLRLAKLLHKLRDPRGIGLLEENLAAITKPVPRGQERFPVRVLLDLADYYRDLGNGQKQIEVLLSADRYVSDPEDISNLMSVAAAAARQMGNEALANELYDRIPSYGYGWSTGISRLHQARHLSSKGEVEKARALAKLPSPGRLGDQAQIHLKMWLAESYLNSGDLKEARDYATAAAAAFATLDEPALPEVKYLEKSAKGFLDRLSKMQVDPLQSEPKALHIVTAGPGGDATTRSPRSIRRLLSIRTAKPVELAFHTTNPQVELELLGKPVRVQSFFLQMVAVTIAPEAQDKNWETILRVTSPELPNHTLDIPLKFETGKQE